MPMKSKLSDVYIPEGVNLWQMIQVKAAPYLDRTALLDGYTDKRLSFREFLWQVNKIRSSLWQIGMRKGDVILMYSKNAIETPVMMCATWSIGGICALCNPLYKAEELIEHLQECRPIYVATHPASLPNLKEALKTYNLIKSVIVYGSDGYGYKSYKELLDSDAPPAPVVHVNPREDVSTMPFSSGTTGKPKGVLLTHYSILANYHQYMHPSIKLDTPEDTGSLLVYMPMFHIYGVELIIVGLCNGKTIINLDHFDLEKYLMLIQKHKCNQIYLVPPIATMLCKSSLVSKYDLSSVQYIFDGAAPLGKEIVNELTQRLHPHLKQLRQVYGMTELSPICHLGPFTESPAGNSGILIPNTECKIIDIETGKELECEQEGEICIRGPQKMKGYLNNSRATKETIDEDGWLHTGDIGYYDKEGFFFVSDRLKELIKYKGFQVAPASLEDLLHTHPSIADVAVVGKPDLEAGELPCAFIVLKPGHEHTQPQHIVDFVKERVAPHKQLRGGVYFVKEIPKNPSGKILRRLLRVQFRSNTKSNL